MLWLAFALIGPLSWAVSTHLDKYLVDKYFHDSNTAVLMVFTAIVGVLALPVIWYFDPQVLALGPLAIGVMTLSGILYMGAMLFYLRAIQTEEASVVAPFFQFNTIFSLLLAWALLHEKLGLVQLAGIGLIVVGVLSVSFHGQAFLKQFKLKLALLMAGATLVLALSSVAFKYFAIEDSFWATTFWTFVGEAIFGVGIIAFPANYRQFIALFKKSPGAVIGLNAANELINLGGGLGVRYATLLAPVGLVTAVSSTTTLFVFLVGVLLTVFCPRFGREDLSRANLIRKGFAALLVTIGVILSGGMRDLS